MRVPEGCPADRSAGGGLEAIMDGPNQMGVTTALGSAIGIAGVVFSRR
jgi:hypothetical protein